MDGGWGWAEEFHAGEVEGVHLAADGAVESCDVFFGLQEVFRFDDEVHHAAEGGVCGGLSEFEFFGEESCVVVLGGVDDGEVFGSVGLDVDFTGGVAASGASGDLGEELESCFGGAEIGEGESGVCVDDADECDAGVVVSFGDHLCADEDVDFVV